VSTIHDLGYKRYVGTRRAPATRWRVIARQQIAHAWKTWWRFKAPLGMAVIITCIAGGMMVFASDQRSRLGAAQTIVMKLVDSALPEALLWYFRAGFVVSLTISATQVASDMQSGAFTFYFARSIKPWHYVFGKLAGLWALLALITLAGPLVLGGLRVGIADSTDELLLLLPVLGKAALVGVIATIVYAAVPLGFSALLGARRQALALWAAYYLILGSMAYAIGTLSAGWVAALDLPHALQAVTYELWGLQYRTREAHIPLGAAIASLVGQVGLAIGLVAYRVRAAHLAGIGGES
jgi:hypothetical protein